MSGSHTQIRSKVRGVADYQAQTAWCRHGDLLQAVREPKNRHDGNAIRLEVRGGVIFRRWRTLGYLSRDLAERFAPLVDRGLELRVAVLEVTGSKRSRRGVNILIEYDEQHRLSILEKIADQRLAVARAREAKRREIADRKAAGSRRRRELIRRAVAGARRAGARFRQALQEAERRQYRARSSDRGK